MIVLNTALIKRKIGKVALSTLGPAGTSSEYVARNILDRLETDNKELLLFGTYEEAYQCIKDRRCNGMVVANAYKDVSTFYMDETLSLIASWIQPTPPYGIASLKNFDLKKIEDADSILIASHHAPLQKLEQYVMYSSSPFYGKRFEVIDCDSTSSAAMMVAQGKVALCLTNAQAVEKYDLKFVSWTTGIDMTWSLFGNEDLIPLVSMLRVA